jgi:hypothetical protein
MVTAATRAQLRRVTDNAGMLMLLVITSPGMATARVVNDTRDWVISGDTYIGLPFGVKLPQDVRGQPSRATLMLDNVGRDLGAEIEARPPGAVLMATMRAVSRARPTEVDYEFTSALSGVKVTTATISAVLGNEDALQAPAVKVRYDPATTPSVFGT